MRNTITAGLATLLIGCASPHYIERTGLDPTTKCDVDSIKRLETELSKSSNPFIKVYNLQRSLYRPLTGKLSKDTTYSVTSEGVNGDSAVHVIVKGNVGESIKRMEVVYPTPDSHKDAIGLVIYGSNDTKLMVSVGDHPKTDQYATKILERILDAEKAKLTMCKKKQYDRLKLIEKDLGM